MMELFGRYSFRNDHYTFYNGGTGFSFKMKGNSFTISFISKPVDGYYYIIIDRDYSCRIKVYTDKPYKYSFNDDNEHLVDIIKANEANDNVFELETLEVDGQILKYDHKYDYTAKVYGDSSIAGFGILSHDGPSSVHTNDSVRDFCFKALYEMNIKMDILAASGYGLAFSAYTCPKNIGIYDYINKVSVNSNNIWKDASKYDILIISLGCNDDSFIRENPENKEENIQKFIKKYQSLIDEQMKINPDIKTLMIYGTLKEEDAYYLYEQTYKRLKPLYKNLYIHKFDGDKSAISNHAYVEAHEKMSEELKMVLKTILK